jgi:ABC-type transport system involved in cytochrome c biogenesis permease subunit
MNPAELNLLHVVHVASVVVLIAYTFFAFAGAPETRKRVMAITGVATLLVLLTGIRMWQGKYGFAPMAWVIVKLVCWLGLSALTGLAYRRRQQTNALMVVALLLAVIALVMVYYRPGTA